MVGLRTMLAWPFVEGLSNPVVLGLLSVSPLVMCKPAIDPYPWRNHAQLRGGSIAERLMSKLAYGWVERCSDLAGCGILHRNISTVAIPSLQLH